jgi:hypothetical protein
MRSRLSWRGLHDRRHRARAELALDLVTRDLLARVSTLVPALAASRILASTSSTEGGGGGGPFLLLASAGAPIATVLSPACCDGDACLPWVSGLRREVSVRSGFLLGWFIMKPSVQAFERERTGRRQLEHAGPGVPIGHQRDSIQTQAWRNPSRPSPSGHELGARTMILRQTIAACARSVPDSQGLDRR